MITHRPAFLLAITLGSGILAGKFLVLPFYFWVLLLFAAIGWSIVGRKAWSIYAGMFALGAVLIINVYRVAPDSAAVLSYDDRQDILMTEGVVDSKPQERAWGLGRQAVFDLKVKRVLTEQGWSPQRGKILVQVSRDKPVQYGQLLRVSGHWHGIFDGNDESPFSYRQWLQERGVFWAVSVGKKGSLEILGKDQGNWLVAQSFKLQRRIKKVFERYLDPEEAGMIIAMVLGEGTSMPRELQAEFINTGTAHVIAISGMNMSIITTIVFFILKCFGLPRAWQFSGTALFLFAYGFLTGFSSSVARACIMSTVILMSLASELEAEALNSLGLAGLILLLSNPRNFFNIGFQLSFGAVLAILVLNKHCQHLFGWLPEALASVMSVSLAAWVGTAGLIFYYFKMITPVSIIANIPIVPLADLTVVLGLGLGVTGLCCAPLAEAFAGCLKIVFNGMLLCVHFFNQVPYGHYHLN